jgi:histidinol-phosphate/aromatic aminotransferase/cobyric acid decarboxylase-like protein
MHIEMKAYFSDLLVSYPSGLNIKNMLAGKLYGVEEDSILVGNGAAELIRALAPALRGSIGVTYPTFNEYPESFTGNEIVPFIPQNFAYTCQDLLTLSSRCDIILLINPDNPSGNCIPAKDITGLLENLKNQNKKLILDESFIDFNGFEENQSLLKQEILDRFPNLVVIRSLSKSYGIPALRLGVLASGDRELIKVIRSYLSIWNINSFGEYFLQIIGKYVKDYHLSCIKIAHERTRFKKKLEETGLFTVYPSEANYLLCRCGDGVTARELAEYLLEHYDIFIKDLTDKKGIPGNSYVRFAVRNRADNDILVEKLSMFYRERGKF